MYDVRETIGDGNSKKSKLLWPKTLVKKWLNHQSKDGGFHADDIIYEGADEKWNNNFSHKEANIIKKSKTEKSNQRNRNHVRQSKIDLDPSHTIEVQNYRIFVATWNVAGKSPPSYLNLEEWLNTSPPAGIYVLGFQEIVPLNAGNVLGTEDNGPARKWQALIRKTLNNFRSNSDIRSGDEFEGPSQRNNSFFSNCHSSSYYYNQRQSLDRRFSVSDRRIYSRGPSDHYDSYSDDEDIWPIDPSQAHSFSIGDRDTHPGHSRYCLVASKQMVGLFLMVWMKSDLRDAVRNLNVSCVGRGLMGYLGNKGAISISMTLHETSFCFVCSHLSSGEKDGDEMKRNSDVTEILRKTRFPQVHDKGDEDSPHTILEHDRVIWLGDLNYRIALSYRCTKALVEMRNWRALLENDQLRIEQIHGRVFAGWNEGRIYFPPTYKYSNNSDRYSGENMRPKEKRRTPAWCDRILWHGQGLQQISYVRGESKFSDHRPVYGLFLAEVESISCCRIKKKSSYSNSRVEVEELLPN
ncbi:Type I inositol polyphosphate 5-phosphatase 4 [Castilleja foliolosa]|uniref:Type I inositol polyphosphate 5-phosphatase 4 n=1 Tax=Castilleja foliolosa TaxID=1961234 RepID=A0ABD3C8G1_9LAMI